MTKIGWETDWANATDRTKRTGKPLFIYFFYAEGGGCRSENIDCRRMDRVTFAEPEVARQLNRHVIPFRVSSADPLAGILEVHWTPHLLFLDHLQQPHHRIIGFMSPRELIPNILLGVAKTHFHNGDLERPIDLLTEIIEEYPESRVVAKAVYLQGILHHKQNCVGYPLREIYEEITKKHPDLAGAGPGTSSYRVL